MDTSETYIKMRVAAIPDLGRGTPYLDTFCATSDLNCFVDRKGDFYVWSQIEPYYCQLERQDQLQEMVSDWQVELVINMYAFITEVTPHGYLIPEYIKQFTSMEQLWFAFVMKENHNKVWDGKDWGEAI